MKIDYPAQNIVFATSQQNTYRQSDPFFIGMPHILQNIIFGQAKKFEMKS